MTAILAALAALAVQDPGDGHVVFDGRAMGSSCRIEIFAPDRETGERAIKEARAEIDRLDRMMTDWKTESPLMEINWNAGVRPVKVPPELLLMVRRSLDLSRLTAGAYDITFAGAGKLWNWRARPPVVPGPEAVRESLRYVGWRHVEVDEKARTVYLDGPGVRIGLGAVAPGYAADRAAAKIRALGVRDAVIDMSGDILVLGLKDGKPWNVAIKHPRLKGRNLAILPVTNGAVSTSGDYERYFEKDGKRYCHIIDPRTGYPASGCRSATVIAPNLAAADALATGVFVMGPREGMALVEKMEGVDAILVDSEGAVHVSSGLEHVAPVWAGKK